MITQNLKVVQENTHRQRDCGDCGEEVAVHVHVQCTMYIPLDVGHSKGWHLGHGDQDYRLQVKEFVNIGRIVNTF